MTTTSWSQHLLQTKDLPPSTLLVETIPLISERNHALDLGAGGLKDTRYLLSQGFKQVTVVDREPTTKELADHLENPALEIVITSFDQFPFPKERYDLINAQFSLPFNGPETFSDLFLRLKQSLVAGGIFCGQLFGTQDEWNTSTSKLIFHTRKEVETLFSEFNLIKLNERITDGTLANGTPKHWHLFHLIAQKKFQDASTIDSV